MKTNTEKMCSRNNKLKDVKEESPPAAEKRTREKKFRVTHHGSVAKPEGTIDRANRRGRSVQIKSMEDLIN